MSAIKGLIISVLVISGVGVAVFISQPKNQVELIASQADVEQPADSSAVAVADAVDLEVPDFAVKTVDGQQVRLSELVKDGPTMLGFWASWCHNCQRNLPIQNDLYQEFKDQVNVLQINMGEGEGLVKSYLDDKGYDFVVGLDKNSDIARLYGIRYTNTHVLIGSDGQLIDAFSGDIDRSHFELLANS